MIFQKYMKSDRNDGVIKPNFGYSTQLYACGSPCVLTISLFGEVHLRQQVCVGTHQRILLFLAAAVVGAGF